MSRSKGGRDDFGNVVAAHRACNRFFGSADVSVKKLMRRLLTRRSAGRSAPDLIEFADYLETIEAED